MKPEEPRFTETEQGCKDAKYCLKGSPFNNDNGVDSVLVHFMDSGHFAML